MKRDLSNLAFGSPEESPGRGDVCRKCTGQRKKEKKKKEVLMVSLVKNSLEKPLNQISASWD